TEGMPPSYKPYLLVASPSTAVAWLTLAIQLEATLRRQQPPFQHRTPNFAPRSQPFRPTATTLVTDQIQSQTQTSRQQQQRRDRPPTACKYCAEAGETVFHWHRECQRRRQRSATTAVAVVQPDPTAVLFTGDASNQLVPIQENFLGGRH